MGIIFFMLYPWIFYRSSSFPEWDNDSEYPVHHVKFEIFQIIFSMQGTMTSAFIVYGLNYYGTEDVHFIRLPTS